MDVFLNGQMIAHEQATISVDDALVQHAVGLFETMSASNGNVFRLQQHLDRLANSAQELGLAKALNTMPLAEAVKQTLSHNNLAEARVRLTVSPGRTSLLSGGQEAATPQGTILIVPAPPTQYDPAYFEQGVTVLIAPPIANPFDPMAGHKTTSYWTRLRTLRQAASAGAGEAIYLNVSNHLASGAISNVFLVKDGQLFTPIARGEEVEGALAAPVMPGITREAIIEIAEQQDMKVTRTMLSIEDLLAADEVFLTNSSWHVLPVSGVEKHVVGTGQAGAVTQQLRTALLALIDEETKGM